MQKLNRRHAMSCMRGWTIRKENRVWIAGPGRGMELGRMFQQVRVIKDSDGNVLTRVEDVLGR